MQHLTVDEIIEFVSLTEYHEHAVTVCTTVNGHIRTCEKCLKTVQAFQALHEEFVKLASDEEFGEYAKKMLLKKRGKKTGQKQAGGIIAPSR